MKSLRIYSMLVFGFLVVSCGQKQEPKERYCGKDISAFEVMDLKKIGEQYKFNDADNKLALDVQDTLNNMFAEAKGDSLKIGMIMHDKEKIGFYIVTPDDKELIERSSCFLLQNDMGGRLPKSRRLLFYAKDQNTLLAAIAGK